MSGHTELLLRAKRQRYRDDYATLLLDAQPDLLLAQGPMFRYWWPGTTTGPREREHYLSPQEDDR